MPPRKSDKGKQVASPAPPPAPEELEQQVEQVDDDIQGEEEKLDNDNSNTSSSTTNSVQDRMAKMKQLRQRMVNNSLSPLSTLSPWNLTLSRFRHVMIERISTFEPSRRNL